MASSWTLVSTLEMQQDARCSTLLLRTLRQLRNRSHLQLQSLSFSLRLLFLRLEFYLCGEAEGSRFPPPVSSIPSNVFLTDAVSLRAKKFVVNIIGSDFTNDSDAALVVENGEAITSLESFDLWRLPHGTLLDNVVQPRLTVAVVLHPQRQIDLPDVRVPFCLEINVNV